MTGQQHQFYKYEGGTVLSTTLELDVDECLNLCRNVTDCAYYNFVASEDCTAGGCSIVAGTCQLLAVSPKPTRIRAFKDNFIGPKYSALGTTYLGFFF